MREYGGQAVVLNREPVGEADSLITFFTEQHGKLVARAKSARKIQSKLSAHLEPGNLVRIRLVEQHGLRVTDSLLETRLKVAPNHLAIVASLVGEAHADPFLWRALTSEDFSWSTILSALGWNPKTAHCRECRRSTETEYFLLASQEFFCRSCIATFRPPGDAVLWIGRRPTA